jgi:hypothetical protein
VPGDSYVDARGASALRRDDRGLLAEEERRSPALPNRIT